MLNAIVYPVIYGFEMLISYLYFSRVTERRRSNVQCGLIGLLCFEGAAVISLVSSNTVWINLLSFCAVNCMFSVLCFRIKWNSAVFHSFILTAIMSAWEILAILLTSITRGSNATSYESDFVVLVLYVILSKTMYFLTCLILTNFVVKGESPLQFPRELYIYPVGVFICLTLFWYICVQQPLSNVSQWLLAIVSIILFGSTVALFITYQHSLEREKEYMMVKSEYRRLQTEKSYYDILERQNQQLMIYAHDAKNHLNCIRDLNTDPRVSRYIEQLSDQLNRYTNYCHSGNQILDVMINKYVAACELKGIQFEYDVHLCNLSHVSDIDLVAILGNLLDNAVSAAEQSQGKNVSIATAVRNSYCVIVIENSCDVVPISRGNRLFTTKQDDKLHGFGLKSVEKTLKMYQGDFDWEYNGGDKRFIVTVMLGPKM